ncbi:methyltransferase domain-containing protein [Halocatena pleomorpha]|uniref:Class I SAM-dependent methyltransferase n=1 Tax=Halocatena pleomorpha TaxID=1785090 RepID=A0A3P3R670_9EURY|nr:class I SAM-dependent methyltransferase [Halocatena pleomorpha]RRJ28063.1 class I SAM-dependent methyltransferase [Halocatena pleomorpha]
MCDDLDPFGRAIYDHHRGDRGEPLLQHGGNETRAHPIESFYFERYDPDSDRGAFLDAWLSGPLLDIGAGVGRDSLYFQQQFETVAIEVSDHLTETMRERGVADARTVDMFALEEAFDRDRFGSVLVYGTQIGLTRSMQGLRQFLGALAYVTDHEGTVVLHGIDPDRGEPSELPGFRSDPTPGLAYRVLQFEYEGQRGEPLLFRLFSPDRLREAVVGTGWRVTELGGSSDLDDPHYQAALTKS